MYTSQAKLQESGRSMKTSRELIIKMFQCSVFALTFETDDVLGYRSSQETDVLRALSINLRQQTVEYELTQKRLPARVHCTLSRQPRPDQPSCLTEDTLRSPVRHYPATRYGQQDQKHQYRLHRNRFVSRLQQTAKVSIKPYGGSEINNVAQAFFQQWYGVTILYSQIYVVSHSFNRGFLKNTAVLCRGPARRTSSRWRI
jgi:hypothetical protein